MKRRGLAFLTALLIMLSAISVQVSADSGDEAVKEARNGVVRVVAMKEQYEYENGNVKIRKVVSTGSGFGIGNTGEETDVFVTNRHVVEADEDCKITGIYILLDSFAFNVNTFELDTSRAVPCTLIYMGEDQDADVAILKAAEPVPGRVALPLLEDESSLEVTDRVSSLGYPASSDTTSNGNYLAGVDDVTVQTGSVARLSDNLSVDTNGTLQGRVIQHSAAINGGNSGGPLVDKNGAVVGINTIVYHGGSDTITNAYYAIRIKYAKDALDSLGIHYDVYAPKSGGSIVLTVIIIAAAAVIAVSVAAVLVTGKKKGGAKTGANTAGKPRAAGTQPAKKAMIRSLAPQHNGMILAAGSVPVLIGRDPANCRLVYAAGTEGVSGRHCSISYDEAAGVFILTDLRSTYGTFLMNGQKLNANVPYRLKPGESFYVGDKANVIRVELG